MVNYKLCFAFTQSFLQLVDTIHEIKCRPIFKERHYSCLLKPFSWTFADIPTNESRFSWLVFIKFFITTSVYRFGVNFKPCVVIRSLCLCCWKALLKLSVRFIQFVTLEAAFLASGNGFSIKYYSFRRVETDFFS